MYNRSVLSPINNGKIKIKLSHLQPTEINRLSRWSNW